MSPELKCAKDKECNKKYSRCVPKTKNGSNKKLNYYQAMDVSECQGAILKKHYPRKSERKINPKHYKCARKCSISNSRQAGKTKKSYSESILCYEKCNEKFPKFLRLKYGKPVGKIWVGKKSTIKNKRNKRIKSVKSARRVKRAKSVKSKKSVKRANLGWLDFFGLGV